MANRVKAVTAALYLWWIIAVSTAGCDLVGKRPGPPDSAPTVLNRWKLDRITVRDENYYPPVVWRLAAPGGWLYVVAFAGNSMTVFVPDVNPGEGP